MTEVLSAVAALGLSTSASFPAEPLSEDRFGALLSSARRERLSGLLAAAIAAGVLPVTDEQHEAVANLDETVQSQVVSVEAQLLELSSALLAAGIDHRVLKGPGFAHRYWPDPSLRPFVDMDVLLPGDRFDEAVAVATGLGGKRELPELRPGFDRRFGKGVTVIGPNGIEWDLHRTLSLGPLSFLIDVADLWSGNERCTFAGVTIDVPLPEVSLVHACLHATTTGTQRLTTLRDVIEIGRVADLGAASSVAARWQVTPAVVAAVEAAHDRLALSSGELKSWAQTLQVSNRERALFAQYSAGRTSSTRLALAAWPYVPGLWQKLSYAAAMVWPHAENQRARGRSRREHLRRLVQYPRQ